METVLRARRTLNVQVFYAVSEQMQSKFSSCSPTWHNGDSLEGSQDLECPGVLRSQ
jgi:hypothetical protein